MGLNPDTDIDDVYQYVVRSTYANGVIRFNTVLFARAAVKAPSLIWTPCLGVGVGAVFETWPRFLTFHRLWFLTASGACANREVRFTKACGGIKSASAPKAPSRFLAPRLSVSGRWACANREVRFTKACGGIKSLRAHKAPSRFLASRLGVGGSRAVFVCFRWAFHRLCFPTACGGGGGASNEK